MTFNFFFNAETWKAEHSFENRKGTNFQELLRELSFDFDEQIDEIPQEETDELGEEENTPNADDSPVPTATANPPATSDPPIQVDTVTEQDEHEESATTADILKESPLFSHTWMGTTNTTATPSPVRTQGFNRRNTTTRVSPSRRTNAQTPPRRHATKTNSNPAATTSGPQRSTSTAAGNTSTLFGGKKHSRSVQLAAHHTAIRRRRAVVFRHKRQRFSPSRCPPVVVLEKKHRRTSNSCGDSQHLLQNKKQRCTGYYSARSAANTAKKAEKTKCQKSGMASANRPPVCLGQKRNRSEQSTSFERRRRLQPSVMLYKRARGVDMATRRGSVIQLVGQKRSTPSFQEENASSKYRLV